MSIPYADSACFTGHRSLPQNAIEPLSQALNAHILSLYRERGVCRFWSGGALGFDLLSAVTVANLQHQCPNLHLCFALPCHNHTKRWGTFEQDLLRRLLLRADEIVYTSEQYSSGCMFLRNRYLVDHSQYCISYLTRQSGGTFYTVNYAKEHGKEIFSLAQLL